MNLAKILKAFFMERLRATTSENMTELGCKFNKILEQILQEHS